MKIYSEKHIIRMSFLLLIVMGLFLAVLGIGKTQARYEMALEHELTLEYQGDVGEIYLLSSEKDENGSYITDENGYMWNTGEWEPVENTEEVPEDEGTGISSEESTASAANSYRLNFLISNRRAAKDHCAVDQNASLALFATVGVQLAEDLTIVLTDGQSTYTAIPTPIQEGMMWYEAYGPGWLYRFYNTAGEELSWSLPGSVFALKELSLTVTGQSEKVAALRLVAFAKPGLVAE